MKHHFKGVETGELEYCGDGYCSGHQKREIVCSCGWRTTSYGSYSDTKDEVSWMMHALSALQQDD